MKEKLINYLSTFVTEHKLQLFKRIIQNRTRYITVALEDIYQSHNASAVLRTCDCFGIQDVHIIENKNLYKINPDVTIGADKWLTLYQYNKEDNNTLSTIIKLRKEGYRIIATSSHKKSVMLNNFNINMGKFVLFFGTEQHGLSDYVMQNADEYLQIPMFGFSESFNISVSAAIILHTLIEKLHNSSIPYHLTDEEKNDILLDWLRKTIKSSGEIEKKFLET